jgi:3-oxoacyl-[acyl-carrier protein] reductase
MSAEKQYTVITGGHGALARAIAAAMQSPAWNIETPGRRDLDVRNKSAIYQYFSGRRVDLLVCAAGIIRDAPLLRLTESAWDETWEVNFIGAAWCAAAALPRMLEQGGGHIVLISSFSALHPPPGQAAYAAAKAALLGLAADLATRYGASNIRVNAVLPGFLATRMTEGVTQSRRAQIAAAHALGRFNTCQESANFIRFLHHDLPHTSGQVFQLDSRVSLR